MAAFYSNVLGLSETNRDDDHIRLESPTFLLVVHRIAGQDGAYMFQGKGDGRFKINVLKRGDLMIQATGETAESARKVADAVVAHLWKTAPPR